VPRRWRIALQQAPADVSCLGRYLAASRIGNDLPETDRAVQNFLVVMLD
jgi:hypothetical protein